jgi:hypothetical protein
MNVFLAEKKAQIPADRKKPIFPVWLVDDMGNLSYPVEAEFQLCWDGCIRPVERITWNGLSGRAVALVVKMGSTLHICALESQPTVALQDTITIGNDWTLYLGRQEDLEDHLARIKPYFRKKLLEWKEVS